MWREGGGRTCRGGGKREGGGKALVRFSQLNHAYMVATRLLAFKSAFQACFQLLGSPSQAEVIVVHGLRGLGASLHEHALVFYAAVCM